MKFRISRHTLFNAAQIAKEISRAFENHLTLVKIGSRKKQNKRSIDRFEKSGKRIT
jgi:hypothetical protein